VGDDGFNFQGPQRREAKRFEPPPWEKEAFDELQRKRAEEEQAAELLRAHEATRQETHEVEPPPPSVEAEGAEPVPPSGGAVEPPGDTPEGKVTDVQLVQPAGTAKAAADDPRVVEMLAGLAVEEPPVHKGFWKVAIASAIVLGAIGGVLIIWAMAAFVGAQKSGATGVIGGGVLLVFGAGFVFGALWLAVRTLRQRGVL